MNFRVFFSGIERAGSLQKLIFKLAGSATPKNGPSVRAGGYFLYPTHHYLKYIESEIKIQILI